MSDLSIEECSDVSESVYDASCLEESTALWNGREVRLILERRESDLNLLNILQKSHTSEEASLKDRKIQILSLEEIETLESLLEENDYIFDLEQGNIQDCKSFKAHLQRIGKEIV